MDIDLLSESPGQSSLPFSSNLLQNSLRRLTTQNTPELVDQNLCQQKAFPSSPSLDEVSDTDQTDSVIKKIATISTIAAGSIIDGEERLEIEMKSRGRKQKSILDLEMAPRKENRPQRTRFPGKSPMEVRRFAAIHRIFQLSNDALVTGIITTKRDIYYQEPELFTTQSLVDRYVDDISYTLGVNRKALNVGAAAKGLIVGDLSIIRKGGGLVQYWSELEGLLIPKVDEVEDVQIDQTQWILVVEKEATFRTLAACEYWRNSSAGTGIIITAKGYPDIQTRQFLYFISTSFPHVPIFALVDYDPDGIGIMSTYKHGSNSLAHETNLTVPSLQWLGIRSADAMADNTGVLNLTKRDRNIAKRMIARPDISARDQGWKRELQLMLMLNMKAEIQIMGNEEQLGVWLDKKLCSVTDELKVEVDADGDILMV